MISTFNLVKLKELLKDFYNLTQIRITVFSKTFEELVAYPEEIASFCQILRQDKIADLKCRECDQNACKIASSEKRGLYIYQCHAGLTEAISPIYMGNILIGYLFFGHVFSYDTYEEGWDKIKSSCSSYQIDIDELQKACYDRIIIKADYIQSAAQILKAVACYLCAQRLVTIKNKDLPMQIDDYIGQHLTENITANTICKHFEISKTHLYDIAKQNYGTGIASYIRNLRLGNAARLLIEKPDLTITEIAQKSGFGDYNYFITLFKQYAGKTPRQYKHHAKTIYTEQTNK